MSVEKVYRFPQVVGRNVGVAVGHLRI